MDVERERRQELMAALGEGFEFFEEATLRHATFTGRKVRADIVAVPRDNRLSGYAFAFEVKEPKDGHYAFWSRTVRQAADYVYASVEASGSAGRYAGRRIAGAFVFPAPPYDPTGLKGIASPFVRRGEEAMVSGIFHLALHFRVGRAFWQEPKRRFCLSFGPNTVWESDCGFRIQGFGLITGERSLGSRRIDVRTELDGWGPALDKSHFQADYGTPEELPSVTRNPIGGEREEP
jgi:hypothetical protein